MPKQLTNDQAVVERFNLLSRKQDRQGFLDLQGIDVRYSHIDQRIGKFLIWGFDTGFFLFSAEKAGDSRCSFFRRGV
jgi:hypothetical protein